ncbi:hypothetical protein [Phaeobacter sp. C3_T13_0]|uniref:hypothetical protein n=1 Tax=Phaeobacter cretensis TaxID=3342641 RepID=UPI0039BC6F69
MRYSMLLAFFLSLVANIAPDLLLAQQRETLAEDQPYSAKTLAALPGRSFVFYDEGEALFGADGAYSYTYSAKNGGGTAWGSYRVGEDGYVCVTFVNGASRCDQYVTNRARTVVIDSDGQRFPVRATR